MTDKAHPFQSAGLDEVMAERGTLKASPAAVEARERIVPADLLKERVELPGRRKRRYAPSEEDAWKELPSQPTQQRLAKDWGNGWTIRHRGGGRSTHQAKTLLDIYREHLAPFEAKAADLLLEDMQWASGSQKVICSRTYNGMVPTGGGGDFSTESRRALGHARSRYVLDALSTVDGAFAAVAALIIGIRRESDGHAMSAREFARTVTKYDSKNTAGPVTAGAMKAYCQWLHYLQQQYARGEHRAAQNAEHQRQLAARLKIEARADLEAQYAPQLKELEALRRRAAEMEAAIAALKAQRA